MALLVWASAWTACSSPIGPQPTPDAPTLNCPTGVSQTSADGKPVTVNYTTPTAIGGATPVTVSCAPPSGTTFAVGGTPVSCTATDSLARQGTCGFTVMVTSTVRIQYTRFVAFGDSLTEGKLSRVVSALEDFPTSYTRDLQAMLQAKYTSQTPTVVNEGHGGEDTATGLGRLSTVLTARAPVEVLLLMHGANDLNKVSCTSYVAPAAENVRQMIRTAQARGSVVFLATLPPQRAGGSNAAGAACVVPYNQSLPGVATATGAYLVDVYAGFGGVATTELVGADGLHLTEAGYDRLANLFFEAIQARLEVKGP